MDLVKKVRNIIATGVFVAVTLLPGCYGPPTQSFHCSKWNTENGNVSGRFVQGENYVRNKDGTPAYTNKDNKPYVHGQTNRDNPTPATSITHPEDK